MKRECWNRNRCALSEPRQNRCFDEELRLDFRALWKSKHKTPIRVECGAVAAFAEVARFHRAKLGELRADYFSDNMLIDHCSLRNDLTARTVSACWAAREIVALQSPS